MCNSGRRVYEEIRSVPAYALKKRQNKESQSERAHEEFPQSKLQTQHERPDHLRQLILNLTIRLDPPRSNVLGSPNNLLSSQICPFYDYSQLNLKLLNSITWTTHRSVNVLTLHVTQLKFQTVKISDPLSGKLQWCPLIIFKASLSSRPATVHWESLMWQFSMNCFYC